MSLEIDHVSVRFGERDVLRDVHLEIPAGRVVSLLGPSGSGKTTLLRVVAGLQPLTTGSLRLGGRDLSRVPAHERGIGLMFQDFALFPHRDVGGNVEFGLRMGRVAEPVARARVAEVLELVGLPGMERRAISTLSGGEQQRVALARALAPRPQVLLLDEPMGSLDRTLRERLPLELRGLFDRLDVTVVYVTHDQDEALAVADRTIVLRDGQVEADAASTELWARPPSAFVARFLGFRNVVEGRITERGIETPWGRLPAAGATAVGRSVSVLLRPEGIAVLGAADHVSASGASDDATDRDDARPGTVELGGIVTARRFRGDHFALVVDVGGAPLEVEVRSAPVPDPGAPVRLALDLAAILLLPPDPAILGR